jgi:hypothetical protein
MESSNLNFLPAKTNSIETPFTTIDKYLDDKYTKELEEINKRISQMDSEKMQLKTTYEKYYSMYTNSMKTTFERNEKEFEICIPSINTIWNKSTKVQIDSMQRLAVENIKQEITDKGYNATFTPKYLGGQNEDDCRGCGDYIAWMVLKVVFK